MPLRADRSRAAAIFIAALAFVVAACGGPSQQARECTARGSADEAAFAQHFSEMDFASGRAPTGEGGQEFGPSEPVVVAAVAKASVGTRFCAQERGRLGTVGHDQEHALPAGESSINLGAFQKKGNYVVRVSVGGVLVRNLTFTVR
ncbi:MAG: hypothetical protein HY535_06770 [Chloroflexi bacterium]|nr:hypothetical protein [Chloroflexota bacterium]